MNEKAIMYSAVLMGVIGCSSEHRIEDTMELSCPNGEPTNINISVSANQRLRAISKKINVHWTLKIHMKLKV